MANADVERLYNKVIWELCHSGLLSICHTHGCPTCGPASNAMQQRGCGDPQHQIVFYAFDVLHLNGRDLMQEPLNRRRAALPPLPDGIVLRASQELPGTVADVLAAVTAMGLKGASKASSPNVATSHTSRASARTLERLG